MARTADRLLIVGHHGKRNAGDDAMLHGLLHLLRRSLPEARYTVAAFGPVDLPHKLEGKVRFVGMRPWSLLRAIAGTDAFIVSGGTMFLEARDRFLFWWILLRWLALVTVARLLGKQVYLVGVGVGPLKTRLGTVLVRRIFSSAHWSSVRDQESLDLLRSIGVPPDILGKSFDLALLMEVREATRRTERGVLGISVLPAHALYYKGGEADRAFLDQVAASARTWLGAAEGRTVRLLEFRPGTEKGDTLMVGELASLIDSPDRVSVIPYEGDPVGLFESVAGCDFFVTMRLHSAVFAYAAGIPMLVINYLPKCASFAAEVGLPASAVIPLEPGVGDLLSQRLHGATVSPQDHLAQLPLEEAVAMAEDSLPPALRGVRGHD